MRKKINYFIRLSVLISLLSGCGFHLQGKYLFCPTIANLIITLDEYSAFYKLLAVSLKQNNVNIVDKNAAINFSVLEINDPVISEEIYSYNSKNQVSQYKLTATCNYKLFAKDGKKIKESNIIKKRIYAINANQLLSNTNEKQVISEELNMEIVNELLKQLSAICN